MQILYRGAEGIIYLDDYDGEKVLVKERVKKPYRLPQIDLKLRKERTRKEVKLLTDARTVGVPTPQILHVDEKNHKIIMQYLNGVRVKDALNTSDKQTIQKICQTIGNMVARLHANNIIHGDLTTSNMILQNDKIYFIDFSLGDYSQRIEDKGTDLKLLREALKSTHFKVLKICWSNILKSYKKEYKDAQKVIERIEEIERRARYKTRKRIETGRGN
jgi:Kae1-associated kinase Bud32